MNYMLEGFPSGQREQTVNLPAKPTEVRILPPPPDFLKCKLAGVAQWLERQPSKLRVAGSNPVSRSKRFLVKLEAKSLSNCAHVAQSVEHILGKDEVTSSILVVGSS
jgi:hypothetical protein